MERQILGQTSASYSLGISVPVGRLIFISGQVALDDQGNVIGPGEMEAQARVVFKQIEKLLAEAGACLCHVVKITTYVTDMAQYSAFTKVRSEVFGTGPYPASATVGVAELVADGLVVEVEAVAVI